MGGFIINKGADLGILGERVGLGPARKMPALANGLPLLDSSTSSSQPADAKIAKQVLRSLGLGKIPGLGPCKLPDFLFPLTLKKYLWTHTVFARFSTRIGPHRNLI